MIKKINNGFTLTELLIATTLISVVFLSSAVVYYSAARFFVSTQSNVSRTSTYIAMEYMARKIALANQVQVTSLTGAIVAAGTAGPELKMRWDYDQNGAPLGTQTTGDDTWVKYGFVGAPTGSLRRRTDSAATGITGDVSAANAEVEPGLVTLNSAGNSSFTISVANTNTVTIRLVTQMGNPAKTIILTRNATAHAATN